MGLISYKINSGYPKAFGMRLLSVLIIGLFGSGAKSVPRIDDNDNMACIASAKQRISAIQGIENTS